jgi:hypothetical protein
MSVDRIEPIRVVPARRADPLTRERRAGEEGGRRQPQEEREQHEERPEDDGLPHIDVRA